MKPDVESRRPRLTRFLTQELLFEYISGSLPPARHRLVEDHLEGDRESQRELLNLSKGLEYAHEIGRLQVSPALKFALQNFEPAWKKRLRAWTLWSSRRGWRILPYAFVCSAVGLTLAVTKPWRPGPAPRVTLAEHAHNEPRSLEKNPSAPAAEGPAAPTVAVVAATPEPTPTPVKPPEPVKPTAPAAEAPAAASAAEKPAGRGQLSRGDLVVREFADAWPAIRDKIVALGGGAAGNVELGWLRRKDQSYFHFSIPESNHDQLMTFLATFGRVQIRPEPSPRVMPKGQIRIILTVKDGGVQEGRAETP